MTDKEKELQAEAIAYYRKQIAELKKENAELKKLKRECETSLCRAEYQYNYEQLTKAKEIIKKLKALYFSPIVTKDDVKRQDEILEEAEQFINENSTYERIQKAKYNYAD